ncbi:MAG: hypothetical protein ACLRZN_04930 [Dialister invisus]
MSEIMLQQTRTEAVKPYFESWKRRFPTIEALAEAEEADVLHAWQGLGYYSRARNLHKAAREITEKYGGAIPEDKRTSALFRVSGNTRQARFYPWLTESMKRRWTETFSVCMRGSMVLSRIF